MALYPPWRPKQEMFPYCFAETDLDQFLIWICTFFFKSYGTKCFVAIHLNKCSKNSSQISFLETLKTGSSAPSLWPKSSDSTTSLSRTVSVHVLLLNCNWSLVLAARTNHKNFLWNGKKLFLSVGKKQVMQNSTERYAWKLVPVFFGIFPSLERSDKTHVFTAQTQKSQMPPFLLEFSKPRDPQCVKCESIVPLETGGGIWSYCTVSYTWCSLTSVPPTAPVSLAWFTKTADVPWSFRLAGRDLSAQNIQLHVRRKHNIVEKRQMLTSGPKQKSMEMKPSKDHFSKFFIKTECKQINKRSTWGLAFQIALNGSGGWGKETALEPRWFFPSIAPRWQRTFCRERWWQ